MDITTNFKMGAAVWDGDKFLLESATAGGNKQMKVTAEVVRAYLGGKGRGSAAGDLRVLPFAGIVEDMEVRRMSITPGALGVDIFFVRTHGCFAAVARKIPSSPPTAGASNWEGWEQYEDDSLVPRQGNLYVCEDDDKAYWYNGVTLRQIASAETGVVQGESLSGGDIDAAIADGGAAAAMPVEAVAEDTAGETTDGAGGEAGKAEVTLVAQAAEVTTEQPRATVTTVERKATII